MLTIRAEQLKELQRPNQKLIGGCLAENTWIEVALVDLAGEPVGGAAYKITLPDGSVMTGKSPANGVVRFERIVAGQCQITFPDFDGREWKPAG